MFSLKELFGKQVVVSIEQGFTGRDAEEKLWFYEIVGKRGLIYPQTTDTVCVQTTPRIGQKLLELFGDKAVFKRRGDFEIELIIPLELTRSVFRYIKPRKRRQLTDEQKALVSARLKAVRPPQIEASQIKQVGKTAAGQ